MTYRLRNAIKQLPILPNPDSGYPDLDTLTVNQKFGRNSTVGTTLVHIAAGGAYPQVTSVTSLEIVSDDANDTAAGTGARTAIISGLVANWEEGSATVSLNGTTPVALGTDFYRVWRVQVLTGGEYAACTTSTQKGTLTVQETGAGRAWATLGEIVAGRGTGQSQIGSYTVPSGKVAYIPLVDISVDSNKEASVYMFVREGADTVTAPFTAVNLKEQFDGISGDFHFVPGTPLGPYVGPCDITFMSKVALTSAAVTVDFTILQFTLKDAS